MIQLNLPPIQNTLKKADGKVWIFDIIRKKYVVLTPEEWVRQHVISFLIHQHAYPKALIKVESGLVFNTMARRADIVVYSREGKPWMLVECKAASEPIHDDVVRQASVYNQTLRAPYVCVSNGLVNYCIQVDWETNTTQVMESLPAFV
jgi:hypothetical protein